MAYEHRIIYWTKANYPSSTQWEAELDHQSSLGFDVALSFIDPDGDLAFLLRKPI